MQDVVAALISFFLIEPLEAEMKEKLADARAPQAVVAEITACARTAAPTVVERAKGDPWWAASAAFQVWTGSAEPGAMLVEAAPSCAGAVRAARPFLTGQSA